MMEKARNIKLLINEYLSDLLYLAYPDLCLICGSSLNRSETLVCHDCIYQLPLTNYSSFSDNNAAERFYGKLPFEKAVAAFIYQKGSYMQQILELIKYKGEKKLGEMLGSYAGTKFAKNGFFNDIDLLVPVPLHKKKMALRGYNQSEWIAKGLSTVCGIPVDSSSLIRQQENETQTTRNIYERWKNVSTIFSLNDDTAFENKHILLVDDVLTSGSTMEACGQAILNAKDSKISFFALAIA
jgi:ComF family protein